MMNSSAGVPRRAAGSASSAGGTWPCGQTSGRSLTVAYSSRATVRRAGSASKQRSGASAQGMLVIGVLLSNNHEGTKTRSSQDMDRLFVPSCLRGEDPMHANVTGSDPRTSVENPRITRMCTNIVLLFRVDERYSRISQEYATDALATVLRRPT